MCRIAFRALLHSSEDERAQTLGRGGHVDSNVSRERTISGAFVEGALGALPEPQAVTSTVSSTAKQRERTRRNRKVVVMAHPLRCPMVDCAFLGGFVS